MTAAGEQVAGALAGPGWAVVPRYLAPDQVRQLATELADRDARGELRPAAIGAGAGRAVRPAIRGDRIGWIDAPGSGVERALLAELGALQLTINRACLLGLVDLECHYAVYAPGARYARHLDRSPQGAERVVSLVLYLNEQWGADDGGELLLATGAGEVVIAPEAGTLVAFLSQRFEHEVRPAVRDRRSVTGWFRRRPPGRAPL